MPGSATAEVYFIVAMMVLILIVCAVAVYAFARTYRKEIKLREARKQVEEMRPDPEANQPAEGHNGTGS
jgi:HAMP domain-containing protein